MKFLEITVCIFIIGCFFCRPVLGAGETSPMTYAKFNSTDSNINFTFSDNDVIATSTTQAWKSASLDKKLITGNKYYWEVEFVQFGGANAYIINGISNTLNTNNYAGSVANSYGFNALNGEIYYNGTEISYGVVMGVGETLGIAVDLVNNKIYFRNSGGWFDGDNPDTGTGGFAITAGLNYYVSACPYYNNGAVKYKLNEDDFAYTPPIGFSNLFTRQTDYASFSPFLNGANTTISNNNRTLTKTASSWVTTYSESKLKTGGKYYFEVFYDNFSTINEFILAGIADRKTTTNYIGAFANSLGWMAQSTGSYWKNGSEVAYCSGETAEGETIRFAVDLVNNKLWIGQEGGWCNSGNPETNTNGITINDNTDYYIGASVYYNTDAITINTGQDSFVYTPPAGFENPHTWEFDAVNIGDSLADGFWTSTETIINYLKSLNSWEFIGNQGIGGQTSTQIAERIERGALNDLPRRIFVTAGTNDYFYNVSTDTGIANLTTIKTAINNAQQTVDLVIGEPPPIVTRNIYGTSGRDDEEDQESTKLIGAAWREWCIENQVKFAPTYQALTTTSPTYEDNLASSNPAYSYDGVHLTALGYSKMADIYNIATIPTRMMRFGIATTTADDEGWEWWYLEDGSNIAGDASIGTLTIPQYATSSSPVKAIEDLTKTLTISPAISNGSVTTQYRISDNNFDRDDVNDRLGNPVVWTTYSAPVSFSEQFIQFRFIGTSVADATITSANISWTAGVDTTPPTVTAFTIPATSNSLTVNISSFTATDTVGVTGYKLTESAATPLPGDSGWESSAQTTYTFSSEGVKTLYAWAKDAEGNVSDSLNDSVAIDITNPSISILSPTDNATNIVSTTDLVITFTEAVDAESGSIVIYKTSDNSTIETIDVTSGQVTGTGTNTITINPSVTLDSYTEYYIQIDATAFDDVYSNSYVGISSTTAWSFTTADTTNPTVSISTPADNPHSNGTDSTADLSGTASDNNSVTSVTWSNNQGGSGSATGTTSWTISNATLQSGDNIFTLTAYDSAGNTNTDTITISYTPADTTNPTVTISTSDPQSISADSLSVAWTDSDNIAVTERKWRIGSAPNASNGTVATSPASTSGYVEGANTLYIGCTDSAGNWGSDSITVNYTLPAYTIGGTISGLVGTVILQNNSGDNLSRSDNGSFTFATSLNSTDTYNVTILAQPTGQTCSISDGSGTVASANITSVSLTCVDDEEDEEDEIAPTIPTNLAEKDKGQNTIVLQWTASSDASNSVAYRIYRSNSLAGTSSTIEYTDRNLSSNTYYTYTVSAYDNSDNESEKSSAVTIKTDKEESSSSSNDDKPKKKRTIASQKTIKKGAILKISGKRFSKKNNVAVYIEKSKGVYLQPIIIKTRANGAFYLSYKIPTFKPSGKYKWYAVDLKTGKKTKMTTFRVK